MSKLALVEKEIDSNMNSDKDAELAPVKEIASNENSDKDAEFALQKEIASKNSDKDAEFALVEKGVASNITDLDSKADELIRFFRADDSASCSRVLCSLMNELEFYCSTHLRATIAVKLNKLAYSLVRQDNPGAQNPINEGPLIPPIDAATSSVANQQTAEFQSEKHAATGEWKSTKRSNCDGSPLKPCKREKLSD